MDLYDLGLGPKCLACELTSASLYSVKWLLILHPPDQIDGWENSLRIC